MNALILATSEDGPTPLKTSLINIGIEWRVAASWEAAAALFDQGACGAMFVEVGFLNSQGLERLGEVAVGRGIPVVAFGEPADSRSAVEAFHHGACGFLAAPDSVEDVERALERMRAAKAKRAPANGAVADAGEMMRLRAARQSEMSLLSAGISHEINNPVSFILGNVKTLRALWRDAAPGLGNALPALDGRTSRKIRFALEEMPAILNEMQGGCERVMNIVQGMMRVASPQSRNMRVRSLNETIEEALFFVEFPPEATVTREVEDGLDYRGDQMEISQVLVNLLTNARDAVDSVGDGPEKEILIQAYRRGGRVVFMLSDSGPGIADANRARIFTPFFSTKEQGKGAGLGLSIAYGIVAAHGGQLTCEKSKYGGAKFTVNLPEAERES